MKSTNDRGQFLKTDALIKMLSPKIYSFNRKTKYGVIKYDHGGYYTPNNSLIGSEVAKQRKF